MSQSPFSQRASGLLLHLSSLESKFSIGDLGPGARQFVDFLEKAGQRWWQMLPIHPAGGGDSPYDSPSAFAGNELFISPEELVDDGLLSAEDIAGQEDVLRQSLRRETSFSEARAQKNPLLRMAFAHFRQKKLLQSAYEKYLEENQSWVWDWALFRALKRSAPAESWTSWEPTLRDRQQEALDTAHRTHQDEVHYAVFLQFIFDRQWSALRKYAQDRGVQLLGDLPMFVSFESVDVWANREMFFLDEQGHRTVQAGVPPDYFSEEGQLWGNPLYRWDLMQKDGFSWWVDRLRRELKRFDGLRLDHFIAFSRYWEVPCPAETAKEGRFISTPGYELLERAGQELGGLPIVAEDLGLLTEEVERLRDHFSLPGMKVLQFAFSPGAETYLPHHYPTNSFAYTGTHDNNTTRGWAEELFSKQEESKESTQEQENNELDRLKAYANIQSPDSAAGALIRYAFASQANVVIVPVQDILNEDASQRMNIPGIATGNWRYRVQGTRLSSQLAEELHTLSAVTERR
ncbi:MAG: 4-alpha-glucanotransferase [Polyangiaceae bacterium]|nr:4-alpha-glucanotransferase [Polyangiaceae bacterium]